MVENSTTTELEIMKIDILRKRLELAESESKFYKNCLVFLKSKTYDHETREAVYNVALSK